MNFKPTDIKLITFDLDDTLWDGSDVIRFAEHAQQQWLDEHVPQISQQLSQEELRNRKIAFAKNNKDILHRVSTVRTEFLTHLFREFQVENPQEKAQACFEVFYHARQNVTLFEGAKDTLTALKDVYRIGALTNGNSDVHVIGINHLFEFVFSAEDFPAAKPAPHMFDAALEHTGLQPEQCLHVGDHPNHDILGAYQAGWKTCWLQDGQREWNNDFDADLTITSVNQLLALLPRTE